MKAEHFVRQNRPCPLCGGNDRFSYFARERRGAWFCRRCGSGDGIALIQKFRRTSFLETLLWLEKELGLPESPGYLGWKKFSDIQGCSKIPRQRAELEMLWDSAHPITKADSPARRYLTARGLKTCDLSTELRWVEALPYRYDSEDDGRQRFWPAMLARVTSDDGRMVSIHRTYLTKGGEKAPVPVVKKLMPGSLGQGFIRLYPPTDFLCLAEGIETALSVHELTGLPVWSVISVGGYQRFRTPPEGVRVIRLYADNDASFAGAAGAYALAFRLRTQYPGLMVEVKMPPRIGMDWNDVLIAGIDVE